MKLRKISAAAIAFLSGLLLSNSHIGRVHADEKGCSTKTLHGFYGFYRSGTTTSTGPLTAVGIGFYDGNGNVTATQTISRNGVFTLDQTTVGQYEVDADCTGRGFLNGVQISRTVVVDGGKEFYLLSMNAGNAVFGGREENPQLRRRSLKQGLTRTSVVAPMLRQRTDDV